jgi:hypothetical protein
MMAGNYDKYVLAWKKEHCIEFIIPEQFRKIVNSVYNYCARLAADAVWYGWVGDGGAELEFQKLLHFAYGCAGIVPLRWEEAEDSKDYDEFLKLKRKFGGE